MKKKIILWPDLVEKTIKKQMNFTTHIPNFTTHISNSTWLSTELNKILEKRLAEKKSN